MEISNISTNLAICQSPICSNAILPHLITIELLLGLGIQQVGHDGKGESSTTSSELLLHEIEDQDASLESIHLIISFHIAEDKSRMPLKLRTRVHRILT